jgi:hypothetical protein
VRELFFILFGALQDDVNDQCRNQHNRDLNAGTQPDGAATVIGISVVATLAVFSISSIHGTSIQIGMIIKLVGVAQQG